MPKSGTTSGVNSGLSSPRAYSLRANHKFTVDELDWGDDEEKPTRPIHQLQSDEEAIQEEVEVEESGYVNMKMTEDLIKKSHTLHQSTEFVKSVLNDERTGKDNKILLAAMDPKPPMGMMHSSGLDGIPENQSNESAQENDSSGASGISSP